MQMLQVACATVGACAARYAANDTVLFAARVALVCARAAERTNANASAVAEVLYGTSSHAQTASALLLAMHPCAAEEDFDATTGMCVCTVPEFCCDTFNYGVYTDTFVVGLAICTLFILLMLYLL